MSDLQIPEEARAAGWDAFMQAMKGTVDGPQIYARTLAAAAPLIVATELERLADDLPGGWNRWNAEYQAGRYDARQYFVNRAAELRRGWSS